MFNFKRERLVQPPIGEGAHGEVFSYQKTPQDSRWVVKRPIGKKIEDLFACLPEIVLGFSCDHPCVVPVKGYSIQPTNDNKYEIYIKLPRMSGGTLADELRKRKLKNSYYTDDEIVKNFYALVSGVDYLHNRKIFHGDIKINNILLDEKGNIKLSDIGSAKFVPDEDFYHPMSKTAGAQNYKAPEIIKYERDLQEYNLFHKDDNNNLPMANTLTKEHHYLADSWSLGLTMLEMCMLVPRLINPYDSVQLIEERLQKLRKEAEKRYQGVILEIIFGLLQTDPAQRLKVSAIKAKLEESFKQILVGRFYINSSLR